MALDNKGCSCSCKADLSERIELNVAAAFGSNRSMAENNLSSSREVFETRTMTCEPTVTANPIATPITAPIHGVLSRRFHRRKKKSPVQRRQPNIPVESVSLPASAGIRTAAYVPTIAIPTRISQIMFSRLLRTAAAASARDVSTPVLQSAQNRASPSVAFPHAMQFILVCPQFLVFVRWLS